ncbi:MAG: toll/interleukin-1 receptor domain-containing protein [Clostridia bacterium]|nr:toll/interleukin-1 receptor domain-containing protein [Clostridia bacterium]
MKSAYDGKEPYIFISYSHRDTDIVYQVIDYLTDRGFRVWYDGGIEAGSEWPEYVASHLRGSNCVLSFVSKNFVASKNCRRELNFAQDLEKPMLNVFIEDTELSDGMKMQLGLNQAVFRWKFPTDEDFFEAIACAKIVEACRSYTKDPEDAITVSIPQTMIDDLKKDETPIAKEEPAPQQTTYDKRAYAKVTALSWICGLIAFSYAALEPWVMHLATGNYINVVLLILFTALPAPLLCVLARVIYSAGSKSLGSNSRKEISDAIAAGWLISFVVVLVACPFFVHTTSSVILKILISLGLNALPFIISAMILPTDS